MALNLATLQQSILDLLSDPAGPKTPPQARAAWADAYDSYAKAATDVSFDRLATSNRLGFQSALIFDKNSSTHVTAALEFERAFIAYWTGATFATAKPPLPTTPCPSVPPAPPWAKEISSIVIAATPGLAVLLTPVFADNTSPDLNTRAAQLASAFHTATLTNVLVLISGTTVPSPSPLAVVNTCTIL